MSSVKRFTHDGRVPTSIQLIAIAHPIDATRLNIVKSDEVEVAWNAMEVLDSKLIESGKQVLGDIDLGAAHRGRG